MISNEEVKNLANLARVALTPEEETKLTGQLGQILDYVGELKNANAGNKGAEKTVGENYNKLRKDGEPIPTLEKGEFMKVKKIL